MFRRIIGCSLVSLLLIPAHGQTWSLEDCISFAMEHNLDLQRQTLSIERENLNLQEAEWAFVPRLSASTSYTMSSGRVLDPTTYEFVKTSYTGNNSTSVSGDITLFEGGRKINALSKAKLSLKVAEFKEESLKYDLSILVTKAFMEALCAREHEKIARETETMIASQLARTQKLYSAGTITETDVLQLQAQLTAAKKDISSATHAYQMARLALCELLGWEDYAHFEINEPTTPLLDDAEWNLDVALERQPDLRLHKMQRDLAELDLKLARSALSPRLSLSAGFGTSYSDARQKALMNENGVLKYDAYPFFQQYADNRSTFVSFSLSIPILNGQATKNGIKRAKIAIKETELNDIETRKKLRRQLLQAQIDCDSSRDQYFQSIEEADCAKEVFKQIDHKYNLGAVDFLTWNTAAIELAKSQYSLAEAKYTYFLRVEIFNTYYYL